MRERKTILVFSFLSAILLVFVFCFSFIRYEALVTVRGKTFVMEVADTERLLKKGLSGHAPLEDDTGMLFVFSSPDKYGFWMKDMLFPIDIVWVDENFKVVHIEKSLSPDTYPTIFYPAASALYVLEIKAGESDLLPIRVGDTVVITKKWL